MSSDSTNGPGDAAPDSTLAGYIKLHDRPPAFEGVDGEPYTVSVETENTPDLSAPVEGYLVFPKWATNGVGVVGHVETPTLVRGPSKESVARDLGELLLVRVKALLDEAIRRRDGRAP